VRKYQVSTVAKAMEWVRFRPRSSDDARAMSLRLVGKNPSRPRNQGRLLVAVLNRQHLAAARAST